MPPPGGGLTSIGAVKEGVGIKISATGVASLNGGFPIGTRLFCFQATPPIGWTTITTFDNTALRLVSGSGGGSGGTNDFTTSFAPYTTQGSSSLVGFSVQGSSQGAGVAESQMGSHGHNYKEPNPSGQGAVGPGGTFDIPQGSRNTTGYSGSNLQHVHPYTGSLTGNSSFSGTSSSQFEVRYIDLLLCERNF